MPFARSAEGTIDALNEMMDIPCSGYKVVGIRLSGTWSGTVTFSGSTDGNEYNTLTVTEFDGVTTATTATSAGQWRVSVSGLTVVRCKLTSYSSGSVVIYMLATAE